ncbi:MAG: GNAT family N-acetyltransferase [Ruminococcus sp.]
MIIRRAEVRDIEGINKLLYQVLRVHHNGRPDIFKSDCKKYTDEELKRIIGDDKTPVFVATDESGNVLGHSFCIFNRRLSDNVLTDIKTLYIDDLCVDENVRGQHIGTGLYEYVLQFAREQGCYNVTLNVWACNEPAMEFYKSKGLKIQKLTMEQIM